MNPFTFLSDCTFLAQIAQVDTSAATTGSNLGTLVIALVSIAAGYVTGLCIWREDRKRYTEAEKVNAGLRAQISEASR